VSNRPLSSVDQTGLEGDDVYTPEFHICTVGVDAGCTEAQTILAGVTVAASINDTQVVSNLQIMTGQENPLPMRGVAATLLDTIADGNAGGALAATAAVGTLESGGAGGLVVGAAATAGLLGAAVYDIATAIGRALSDAIPDTAEPPRLDANMVIVRGGEKDLPAAGTTFSGAFGATVPDAAAFVPHGTIRSSTVKAIMETGGSVIPSPELTRGGVLNIRHVNIVEGRVSTFSAPFPNPIPKNSRIQ
jgi:hypothetical protein